MTKKSAKAELAVDGYPAFAHALRRVLRVSHAELKERLDAEREVKKRKPRTSALRRASGDKG
jgi:hypothetical protein